MLPTRSKTPTKGKAKSESGVSESLLYLEHFGTRDEGQEMHLEKPMDVSAAQEGVISMNEQMESRMQPGDTRDLEERTSFLTSSSDVTTKPNREKSSLVCAQATVVGSPGASIHHRNAYSLDSRNGGSSSGGSRSSTATKRVSFAEDVTAITPSITLHSGIPSKNAGEGLLQWKRPSSSSSSTQQYFAEMGGQLSDVRLSLDSLHDDILVPDQEISTDGLLMPLQDVISDGKVSHEQAGEKQNSEILRATSQESERNNYEQNANYSDNCKMSEEDINVPFECVLDTVHQQAQRDPKSLTPAKSKSTSKNTNIKQKQKQKRRKRKASTSSSQKNRINKMESNIVSTEKTLNSYKSKKGKKQRGRKQMKAKRHSERDNIDIERGAKELSAAAAKAILEMTRGENVRDIVEMHTSGQSESNDDKSGEESFLSDLSKRNHAKSAPAIPRDASKYIDNGSIVNHDYGPMYKPPRSPHINSKRQLSRRAPPRSATTPVSSNLLWADGALSARSRHSQMSSRGSMTNSLSTRGVGMIMPSEVDRNLHSPFSRRILASRESHCSQDSRASSLSGAAETLERMRQFGIVQNLSQAGTLPPGRRLRLDPIRMPNFNTNVSPRSLDVRRRSNGKPMHHNQLGEQSTQHSNPFDGTLKDNLQQTDEVERKLLAESFSTSSVDTERLNTEQNSNTMRSLRDLMPDDISRRLSTKTSNKLMTIIAGPPTPKEIKMMTEEYGWEMAKKRLHDNGSAAWAKWCAQRVRKAPKQLRRQLETSKDFIIVQSSSTLIRRRKERNDAASANLRDYLIARRERERAGAWLRHTKNANPKLASQWMEYLERSDKARSNIGPTVGTSS